MKFDLKRFLKNLKLNEDNISMVLGAFVIVIVGILIVNYFKDKKSEILPGISTGNTLQKEHVVAKGDTLWSIAEDTYGSGYNWVDIKSANSLKSETIEVGLKLNLPDVSAKKPTSTKLALKTNLQIEAGKTYTVVKGDTLWDISIRAYGDGYKWPQIAEANKLVNPNIIHAGNVLTIPR